MLWCVGMFASGSTWAYNALRDIARAADPARAVRGGFVNTLADCAGLDETGACHVMKSHDVAAEVAALMEARARRLVVTLRDPRDAVTSLMRYQRYPFAMALDTVANSGRFAAQHAQDRRALVLRYEDGFIDDPATLDRLAAHAGWPLAPAERDRIFAASRRAAVEARIREIETRPEAVHDPRSGDFFDPDTQWHRHHAGRDGEVGRWRRMLLPVQVAAVEAALAPLMARFAYAPAALPEAGYRLRVGSFTVSGL